MSGARVLVAGWIDSPHVGAWAGAVAELGYEVHLAGERAGRWPDTLDRSRLASLHELPAGSLPGIRDRRIGHGLARAARAVRPDLVHAHWAPAYGWMAARAGLRPLITSAWGSDLLRASPRLLRRSRRALRASDLVLADSAPLADAARALAGPALAVEIVQWGVDLDRFAPGDGARAAARARLGIGDEPLVLTTRALDPLYNPTILIDAFARLRERMPAARLLLKHPGAELPPEIAERLDAHGLRDATHVVGFVAADELADLYRAADAYVSIPSSDSSPRSVWEALACGTPTVVSDLPWARDALTDGEDALLVPVDAAAVAAALERLLSRDGAAIGAGGRALARSTMDRRDHVARLGALYESLLSPALARPR